MTAFAALTPERFDAPLYALPPEEWSEQPRDYTVTVTGPERYDGEKPYTYVVRDHTTEHAWIQALTWHMRTTESLDVHVVASESQVGLPPDDAGYHWNDLRSEAQLTALERAIDQARDLVNRYQNALARFRTEDGDDIDPERHGLYDETRADFGDEAIDMVTRLAKAA